MAEMGCEGTIGNNDEMTLQGVYQQKSFIKIIKKYTEEYVRCNVCKGYKTEFEREEKTRLVYLKCQNCQASRTVQQVASRY